MTVSEKLIARAMTQVVGQDPRSKVIVELIAAYRQSIADCMRMESVIHDTAKELKDLIETE